MLVVIEAGCWCQVRWFKGRLKVVASCPVLALLAGARRPSAGLTSLGGVGSERATRGYRPNPPRYSDAIVLDSSWKWTENCASILVVRAQMGAMALTKPVEGARYDGWILDLCINKIEAHTALTVPVTLAAIVAVRQALIALQVTLAAGQTAGSDAARFGHGGIGGRGRLVFGCAAIGKSSSGRCWTSVSRVQFSVHGRGITLDGRPCGFGGTWSGQLLSLGRGDLEMIVGAVVTSRGRCVRWRRLGVLRVRRQWARRMGYVRVAQHRLVVVRKVHSSKAEAWEREIHGRVGRESCGGQFGGGSETCAAQQCCLDRLGGRDSETARRVVWAVGFGGQNQW